MCLAPYRERCVANSSIAFVPKAHLLSRHVQISRYQRPAGVIRAFWRDALVVANPAFLNERKGARMGEVQIRQRSGKARSDDRRSQASARSADIVDTLVGAC